MINIQKIGNAIVIDFTDNDKYLHDGTIEVAPNELMIVIDESDMATFKKMSNGDTLFGQLISQIQIQGEAVTKDNIIDKFGMIGFASEGGGAVNSVNGQTGEVVITAASLGAITKADADAAYAAKSDLNSKADISAVEALSTEVAANRTATTALTSKVNEDSEKIASLDTEMDNKANSADVPTNTQFNNLAGEVANKADKTSVYTKAEADEKFATNVELNHVKAELATKADTSSLNDYALKSEITGLATKEELADYQPIGDYATTTQLNSKQDTLVSGQNIKTINGQSVIGEGNIEIQQSELPIASADTLGGVKVGTGLSINPEGVLSADSPEWNNISGKPEDIVNITERLASKLDTATYNSEKSSFATKDELNSKADASAIADMATQTWVQGQGYLTEVPSNYVTDSELTEGLAGKQDKGDYALKSDLNTLATKEELATKADASALSSKQDTLVSGTNIKTINGETILGAGDITIQAGGVGQNYYVGETLKGEIFNDYEGNQAKGQHSHAEGSITRAIGPYSHTEGWSTSAEGNYSHSEGEASRTGSMGDAAHAEGGHTVAGGQYSHTEGGYTVANGTNTHAEGDHTKTTNNAEHSQGKYNKSNTGATDDLKTIHSIGIGVDTAGRKNAQEVMTNGDHYIIGIGGYDGTNPEAAQTLQEVVNSGGSSITVDTAMSDTSENAVQNKVIKKYIDDLVGNILTQLQEING